MTKKQNVLAIQNIDIRLIDESPLNPRRIFNENELQELADNIKAQGLIQPITLRPKEHKKELGIKDRVEFETGRHFYEVVCGARRYKACVMAGMKEIPAIVRELTDAEAFDAMITENLQRKDVESIDEAVAFKALIDKGNSFEELSARFGKSHQFIRQRVKLNDLIAEFSDMLANKSLQVNHAQELCKLEADDQKEIYTKYYGEDASPYYNWKTITSKELKERLANRFNDLDNQEFDKTECQSCKFRCGANVLFEEFEANTCTNSICFEDKIATHEVKQIVDRINDDLGIILTPKNEQESNPVILKLKELGYAIQDFEDYDWEWPTKEDKNVEKHRRQLEELGSGDLVNVLVVGCWPNDAYTNVYARFKTSSDTPKSDDDQVYILQSKDKRNKEIQGEKTIADLREMFKESNYENSNKDITKIEDVAILVGMYNKCSWEFKQKFRKGLQDDESIYELLKDASPDLEMKITRAFIKETITNADVLHWTDLQVLLQAISTEKYPEKTKEIELLHEGTYLKRQESIEKQIKALEK